MYIDFQAVKRLVTIEQAAAWLGLTLKNNRCVCPVNNGDKREMVFNIEKQVFNCFGCSVGGDVIQLVAHVQKSSLKDAALALEKEFRGYVPAKKGLPDGGLDYLDPDHAAVKALGLSAEAAKRIGAGYAPRGTMIKRVLIPIREPTGKLIGYLGINLELDPPIKFPSDLTVKS